MILSRLAGRALLLVGAGLLLGCNLSPLPEGGAPPSPLVPAEATKKSEPAAEVPPLIQLTPDAAATVRRLIAEQKPAGPLCLRVRIVPGGCCGFFHKLDLDPETTAEDHTFDSGGVKVVVFKRQVEMLRGTRVDYGREGDREGFKVHSPNLEGESVKKWLPELEKEKREGSKAGG